MKHITVRLAWHDSKWNGRICESPHRNVYCVGSYSLLSERLQRDRDLGKEDTKAARSKPLDVLYPEYVPPCFWSSNAFSPTAAKITHNHPFKQFRDTKKIPDTVEAYTAFTWPFRLSFVHTKANKKRHGSYPPDLPERVSRYRNLFTGGHSIVFFS